VRCQAEITGDRLPDFVPSLRGGKVTAMDIGRQIQRHIMVVDDDGGLVAELSSSLRAAGYRVTGVASDDDALEVAAQDVPDLAVLDMRIPDMGGVELGSQLRKRSSVPFLCLSDYVDRAMVTQAAEEGALGYLVKPLAVAQIMPSIEAALTQARDIRKLRENESKLNAALAGSRAVSMAVGLLMMRDRINREQALEVLRSNARSQRRPAADIANELLKAVEKIYIIRQLNDNSGYQSQFVPGSWITGEEPDYSKNLVRVAGSTVAVATD
jgi:two-component system, response regulator PdtaR